MHTLCLMVHVLECGFKPTAEGNGDHIRKKRNWLYKTTFKLLNRFIVNCFHIYQ